MQITIHHKTPDTEEYVEGARTTSLSQWRDVSLLVSTMADLYAIVKVLIS